MIQNNISFDSFYGRIIDPLCYKLLENNLMTTIGIPDKKLAPGLHDIFFDLIGKYVTNIEPLNKSEYTQIIYFIMMNCISKLIKYNRPIKYIINPTNKNDYLVQKLYLMPLLDLMTEIHPDAHETNSFVYEYVINQNLNKYPYIYIYRNANEPNSDFIKINGADIKQYLIDNNLCLNISGALFYTHSHKLGLMTNFLEHRLSMRKKYKNKMYEYEIGSEEYKKYNHIQNVCKVNANSSYGLTGLNSFRYSNVWLARSTTLSGRLALKTAQVAGELILNNFKG